jgi:hypothetical protein
MTRRHITSVGAPRDIDSGETRSQFLLARKQAAAHASTAQIRAMGGWAAPEAPAQRGRRLN